MIISMVDILVFIFSLGLLHGIKSPAVQLSVRVLLGLGLGIGYGFLLKLTPANSLLDIIKSILYLIGNGYLALLKMLVIPLILTSIIHAILNLGVGEERSIKTLSFYTCGILLAMTSVSSLIGISVGHLLGVGSGLSLPEFIQVPKHAYTGVIDTLMGMLPANPVSAMSQENTIAIVIFAALLGVAARTLDHKDHDKMKVFREFVASLFAIVKRLANLVLSLTPYGILALMSLLLLDQGTAMLSGMIRFILAMYAAMVLVMGMHSLLLMLFGVNPVAYFKKAYIPLLVAFTTRSSFGTLPVTEETLRDKFRTSQTTATFVPSIGATIGMNACAGVFPAMLVVMTLAVLHQPLTLNIILMVMFINALASLGISGIPGTAYIAATVTLTSLNLPYAIVALVQGIDPVVDMGRTAVNVNGVLTTSLMVENLTRPDK
ncbi:L-cystine uptake protein TcyP [Aquicella siphonis]|uniref:L-cystine uptake protein TcyP n=1 Tax=Aquicella siphonis TaxID=254247 RepID=A0A5E4PJH0_9COXI|nr:cation:dicarboxylase symporter family transporter [Aquicella siphonis]VVC77229.1 L-cystine uptake protein TcyP [Aquicella siphonis]